MTTYEYECQECQHVFAVQMRMSEYDPKKKPPCTECGATNPQRLITPWLMSFKGDDWATKNSRIKGQMKDRRKKLAVKENEQKRDGMLPTLAPNVGGERTDSWADAAKLAKDKGKDTSGYERLARKEKKDRLA